jgi:hypothetical protein
MVLLLLTGGPLAALLVWAAAFDLRRRRALRTAHDIGAASRRARADAEGRGASFGPGV